MAESKRIDGSGFVNEERLICTNCRGQFSFYYTGRWNQEPDRPGDLLRMTDEDFIRTRRRRYRDLWEAYERCPHCGLVQAWMIRVRKRLACRAVFWISIAVSAILSLAIRYLSYAGMFGFHRMSFLLSIPLGLAGMIVGTWYIRRRWNPNRYVDVEHFGGAARISDVTPPADWNPEICLSLVLYSRALKPSRHPMIAVLGTLASMVGLGVFLLPLLSEEIAYGLQESGRVMLPFAVGLALMILGPAVPVALMLHRIRARRRAARSEKVEISKSSMQTERSFKAERETIRKTAEPVRKIRKTVEPVRKIRTTRESVGRGGRQSGHHPSERTSARKT
jgi:hypothetical protein